jgi:competence protein ComEC
LTIIAYIGFVFGFLLSRQIRRRFHQTAALLLAASLLMDGFAYVNRPSLEIIILDVGQGDCTLIRSRGGTITLIDAGSESAGLMDVRPVLQALGVRSIDQAVLTHGHNDHAGGFLQLLADGMIERLFVPFEAMQLSLNGENKTTDDYETDLMNQVLAQAAFRDIPVQPLQKNDTIPIDQTAKLIVLSGSTANSIEIESDELASIAKNRGANAFNLVLRLSTNDWSIVLTGDCDRESEMALLNDPLLDANLLRVAHHGSATATGQALIDAVSPDLALISVGKNNYGHPSLAVLDRLALRQIPVARTDRQGAITIRVYPGRYSVKTVL